MTLKEVHDWCRSNGIEARGIYRGKDFVIRGNEALVTKILPSLGEVFHWDVQIDGNHYPTSPSDMERLVSGKMSLEVFKGTHRGG
ncbi:MAG: hypothetical protein ACREQK_02785 [Candidatus Binatia bacterium]